MTPNPGIYKVWSFKGVTESETSFN